MKYRLKIIKFEEKKIYKDIYIIIRQRFKIYKPLKVPSFPGDPVYYHEHLLSTHLLSALFTITLTCYQFTFYLFHLLSALLRSEYICSRNTFSPASLAIRSICCQASIAIKSFFFLSSYNCYQCLSAYLLTKLVTKYVAIEINSFQNKLLSKPVLSCYHIQLLFSK